MIAVSVGADYNHAHVERREFVGFEQLAAFVLEQQAGGGKVGPYICAPMRENHRNGANAELVQHLTLDFDHGLAADTPAAIWRAIEAAGWRASMWTTRSSTPDAPRLRILLALDRALTKPEYGACYRGAVRFLGDRTGLPLKGDPRCEKPEQPAILPQPTSTVWSNAEGAPLISDAFIAYDPAPTGDKPRKPRKNGSTSNGARHPRMSDVLKKVLSRFENVQQIADDRWTVCCPCHDSKSRASLHVSDGGDRVLMIDFGDCSTTAVLAAVGLTARDLFADSLDEPPATPLEEYAADAAQQLHRERGAPPETTPADTPRAPPLREMPKPNLATAALEVVRFLVALLLPRGFVSLLSGHGDSGKTMLALVVAAHVACGRRFADLATVTGRVLFVSLEDSAELIWLRLRRIADVYELDPEAITANITVLDLPDDDDADGALAVEQIEFGTRRLVFTPAFDLIRDRAAGHDLIVVDNSSDAYDANEIERRLVRRFMRKLQRIGRKHDAAVWLLAHLDKAGVRHGTNGESYSGSTAWHNTARSRMALLEVDKKLELVHEKCNLAKKLEHPIALERGEHGVLVPISRAQREQDERADERAVLAAVRGALKAGITVPTAVSGPKTTMHVLAGRPELSPELAEDRKRVRAAVTKLERDGAIRRESYVDDHRHAKERYRCGSSVGE